jgi:hypothetical protein
MHVPRKTWAAREAAVTRMIALQRASWPLFTDANKRFLSMPRTFLLLHQEMQHARR